MQNLVQLGPKICVCFFFVFSPSFFFCYFFFYSSPDLNFCLYSSYILQDFRFKNTFSASDRAHRSPSDTPYAMCASVQLTLTLHQIHPPPHHCRRRVYSREALCSFGVLAVVNILVDELWNSLSL